MTCPPAPVKVSQQGGALRRLSRHEGLNFLLTNRIPRRLLTVLVGRISRIEQPVVCAVSLWLWRRFTELDLADARETRFRSLHHVFTRELWPGARPPDPGPDVLASPCDAIVGAAGTVRDGEALQVKGMRYGVAELMGDAGRAGAMADGVYVTLRLTSAMYHRFHAPHDARVEGVTHVPGDCFNVNPPALARLPSLFCRNERAAIHLRLREGGHAVTLVAVAAILVAGIRLRFLDLAGERRHGPARHHPCSATLRKGEEMGWFEHGSTIVVFAGPGARLADGIRPGHLGRAGEALMRLPRAGDAGPRG